MSGRGCEGVGLVAMGRDLECCQGRRYLVLGTGLSGEATDRRKDKKERGRENKERRKQADWI